MAELEEAPQNTKSTTLKGLFETADECIDQLKTLNRKILKTLLTKRWKPILLALICSVILV